jgi:hypothetical protein
MSCLPMSYLPTYLPTYVLFTYLPTYLPSTYLCPTYLLLFTKIPYLFTYLPICLSIYLAKCLLTSLRKNWSSNVVSQKNSWKFKEKHVKYIWYHTGLQSGRVVYGQDISVEPRRPRFNPLYQHILCEYVYS